MLAKYSFVIVERQASTWKSRPEARCVLAALKVSCPTVQNSPSIHRSHASQEYSGDLVLTKLQDIHDPFSDVQRPVEVDLAGILVAGTACLAVVAGSILVVGVHRSPGADSHHRSCLSHVRQHAFLCIETRPAGIRFDAIMQWWRK